MVYRSDRGNDVTLTIGQSRFFVQFLKDFEALAYEIYFCDPPRGRTGWLAARGAGPRADPPR